MNRRGLLILGSAAIASPRADRAQQKAMPVIGCLSLGSPGPSTGCERRRKRHAKGVQLLILKASTESEIDAAGASLVNLHADALLASADLFFDSQREKLVALAARRAVPAMYILREYAAAGGLISYGPSVTAMNRVVGGYVGKILNGAKPADLPVQQPPRFELVINLKTAKALGLTVPPLLLTEADEVIE